MTTFPSFVFSGPNSDTIGLYWDLFVAFVAAGVSFAFKLKIYRYLIATIHRDHPPRPSLSQFTMFVKNFSSLRCLNSFRNCS